MEIFAAAFAALYAGHHVGDYWIQTDHQAQHKGAAGVHGRRACLAHVISYTITQGAFLVMVLSLGGELDLARAAGALALSAITHYAADRREHGLMFRLARLLPGKARFLQLGAPRDVRVYAFGGARDEPSDQPLDSPTLGTGAWALDQSWHIAFGVFLPALVLAL